MTIQCPECQTTYLATRCGIELQPGHQGVATVVCVLCKSEFDVMVTWGETTPGETPGWWARTVLRKPVVPPTIGHTIVTTTRT